MEITIKSSQDIISTLTSRVKELELNAMDSTGNLKLPFLLRKLFDSVKRNSVRNKHGHRFDQDLKLFSSYVFLLGGPMVYEFLYVNVTDGLPCPRTVENTIQKSSPPIKEGVIRAEELKCFLLENNYPLHVVISEDGTRIQQKFTYDSNFNQIVGPVLPLGDNGIPITNSFPATSAAIIASHFRNGIPASTAYTVMAQPVQEGAASFCLCLFGTDNRFTSEHVFKRWDYITEELAQYGITVEAFSSDGDPKLLKAMHSHMFHIGSTGYFKPQWKDWFYASASRKTYTVLQDTIHTANKMKTRLDPSHLLPIGKYTASQNHIRILIDRGHKEDHGLGDFDLNNQDKMNFNSSVKLSCQRVTSQLPILVSGSEGTVAYLVVLRYIIESFLNKDLSPSERLYKIWYAAFFLRFWKLWLLNHQHYNMKNFVTSNFYMCVEILAHAIVKIVIRYRENGTPKYFLPHLFSSQSCESFFRMARSLTSTLSTVINFTMKDFLDKVKRIDILQHIACELSDKLVFPRDKRRKALGTLTAEKLTSTTYLPSDEEILEICMEAKSDAAATLQALGINFHRDTSMVQISKYLMSCENFEDEDEEDDLQISNSPCYLADFSDEDVALDLLAAFPEPNNISEVNLGEEITLPILPNSPFLVVRNSKGSFVNMKKSTFCWLLATEGPKLSIDRQYKVRQQAANTFGQSNVLKTNSSLVPGKKKEISVGDWCLFRPHSKILIAQVIGFSYLTGSNKSYTLLKAPIVPPEKKSSRGLGCLCTWYSVSNSTHPRLIPQNSDHHKYVNIDKYLATIAPPHVYNSHLRLSPESFHTFNNM